MRGEDAVTDEDQSRVEEEARESIWLGRLDAGREMEMR